MAFELFLIHENYKFNKFIWNGSSQQTAWFEIHEFEYPKLRKSAPLTINFFSTPQLSLRPF